ncbi:hypothetical protein HOF92_09390 [bacterium]|jgi:RNAse (barnase) inhibitor barstar|nr:hypothetical protein [bacterium]
MLREVFRLVHENLGASPSFRIPFAEDSPLESLRSSIDLDRDEMLIGTWENSASSETRIFVISSKCLRISRREEESKVDFQLLPFSDIAGVETRAGAEEMPDRICIQRASGAETWLRATGVTEEDETALMVDFIEAIAKLSLQSEKSQSPVALFTLNTQLFSHAKGGRSSPFWTGYRAKLRCPGGILPIRFDATLLLEKRKSVRPGDKFRCRAWIREPEKLPRDLFPGDELYLEENKQRIGVSTIEESCNLVLEPTQAPFQILYELQDKNHQTTPTWHRFKSIIEIKGSKIQTEQDFYDSLYQFSQDPGERPTNLSTLWKWLGCQVEHPCLFRWTEFDQSSVSLRRKLPPLLNLLLEAKLADLRFRL